MPWRIEPPESSLEATAVPFPMLSISGHPEVAGSSSRTSPYWPTLPFFPSPANASIASSRTTPITSPWMTSKPRCPSCSTRDGRTPRPIAPVSNWTGKGKKVGIANMWEFDLDYCTCNQDARVEEHPFPKKPMSSKKLFIHGASKKGLQMSDADEELLPEVLSKDLDMQAPEHAVHSIDLPGPAIASPAGRRRNGNGSPRPFAPGFTSPTEGSAPGGHRNMLGSHSETGEAGTAERSFQQEHAELSDAQYAALYGAKYRRLTGRDIQELQGSREDRLMRVRKGIALSEIYS